jgi:excinuclease ABC subunit C
MDPSPAPAAPARLHIRLPRPTLAQRRALRARVRERCENRPGVYRMLGAGGAVLYVGKSRRLRTRLLVHFRARGRRNKSARILRHTFDIEWEYTPTEFSALLAELRLIKRHRPEFNDTYVTDEWPRAYIALTGGEVPGLRIVPRSDDPQALALFGPFRRVAFVRSAVRALAEAMQVRDCSIDEVRTARTRSLWFDSDARPGPATGLRRAPPRARTRAPGCLRVELGSCAGPCIGGGAAESYASAVQEVRHFLEGRSRAPIDRLHAAMERAAGQLEFERAGVLRDRIELLTWLYKRVRQFRANVDRLTFRYHARGEDGQERVYLIRRGTLRAELPAPSTREEQEALEALATRIYEGPDPTGADIPLHDLDEFHLVSSWFRRHPDELERTRAPMHSPGTGV